MYQALPPPTPGSKKTEAGIKEGAARGRMTLNAEVDVGGLIWRDAKDPIFFGQLL